MRIVIRFLAAVVVCGFMVALLAGLRHAGPGLRSRLLRRTDVAEAASAHDHVRQ